MYQSDVVAAIAQEHRRDLLRDGDQWRLAKLARAHDRRVPAARAQRGAGLQMWLAALRIGAFSRVSPAGRHGE